MDPLARTVILVLGAYCTVIAQKPGNANSAGGSTNASTATVQQPEVGSSEPSVARVTVTQLVSQAETQVTQPAEPPNMLYGFSDPCRIVFQSTPADDARATTAFCGEPGWGAPESVPVTPELAAVSFDCGGTNLPSPLCFPAAGTVTVHTLILSARADAADLATLIDEPETARLRIASAGGAEPEMSGAEQSLTGQFQPDRWLVLEVGLSSPTNLATLFFGGSAGRPEWSRNWRGEIAEIVGFSTPPSSDVRAGVANYLAVRWGFGGYPATPVQRQAAIDAGLNYGAVWGTVLFIR